MLHSINPSLASLLLLGLPLTLAAQEGVWQPLSDEGFTPRWNYAVAAVPDIGSAGTIYTFGGRMQVPSESRHIFYDVIEAFDVATGAWSTVTPMGSPSKRMQHTASYVNGKIYLIGGDVDQYGTHTNMIEEFDPYTRVFREVTPTNSVTAPWNIHTASVVNGKIYLAGGSLNTGLNQAVQIYDPAANTWESITPSGTVFIGRSSLSSAVLGTDIYYSGGIAGFDFVNAIQRYDTKSGELATLETKLPTTLAHHSSETIDGKIYFVGGITTLLMGGVNSSVYMYDPFQPGSGAFTPLTVGGVQDPNGFGPAVLLRGNIYQIGFADPWDTARTQVLILGSSSVSGPEVAGSVSVRFDDGGIRVTGEAALTAVSLYDIYGREIACIDGGQDVVLSLASISDGAYLLRLHYPDRILLQKFVYQR